ncbi:MAG: hypothetical protein M3N48_14085 [Verrucomicrobiota bacterium]|nr:hypothetical protein [Verrucomicrobiota bacterium]
MTSTTTSPSTSKPASGDGGVPLLRLCVLRGTYLLLVIGLGGMILPQLIQHEPLSRGAIPSLLCGVWLLAFAGLRYPLQMLPLLMFEFVWKATWLLVYGLPQWYAGTVPPTFAEDFYAITFGVILMPIVIPWGYVYRHYIKASGDRWTRKEPDGTCAPLRRQTLTNEGDIR